MKHLSFFLLISCIIGLPNGMNAQSTNSKKLAIQASGGFELGWWIHNLGSTEAGILNNRGWARTHHTPSFMGEIDLIFQVKRFKIGVGYQGSLFVEDDIRGNEDAVRNYDRVKITQGNAITFWKYSAFVEYDLFKRGKWTVLSPHCRFGGFQFNSTHPDHLNFDQQLYYEVGFSNSYRLKRGELVFRPKYSNASIGLKQERYFNETHNITGVGVNVGLRFWLL